MLGGATKCLSVDRKSSEVLENSLQCEKMQPDDRKFSEMLEKCYSITESWRTVSQITPIIPYKYSISKLIKTTLKGMRRVTEYKECCS